MFDPVNTVCINLGLFQDSIAVSSMSTPSLNLRWLCMPLLSPAVVVVVVHTLLVMVGMYLIFISFCLTWTGLLMLLKAPYLTLAML